MSKNKAMLITTVVFTLLSCVLAFVLKLRFDLFVYIGAVIAVYGFASMIDDFNRWIAKKEPDSAAARHERR